MVLFTAEVIVVLLIAIIIVVKGGAHGLTLKPLSPTASPHGFNGLVTGFVFAALSFVGFEGASTLERGGPRADDAPCRGRSCCSCVVVGLIYVFCTWAEVNGLGIDGANKLTGADTPWNDLAATFAPWMKWFIIIASVSSMFAVMVNSNNGIIRIFYAMGREGLLPQLAGRRAPQAPYADQGGPRRRRVRDRRWRWSSARSPAGSATRPTGSQRLRLSRLRADAGHPAGLRADQPGGRALPLGQGRLQLGSST